MPIDDVEHRQCRVCNELANSRGLIKYGVRHYAHPRCLIESRGVDCAVEAAPMYRRAHVILCAREMGLTVPGAPD